MTLKPQQEQKMAKNNVIEHEEIDEDYDFDMFNLPEEDQLPNVMECLIATNNHHMSIALELTKLIIEKSPQNGKIDEESILATFKRAANEVAESSPLKDILNEF